MMKQLIKQNYTLFNLAKRASRTLKYFRYGGGVKIINKGCAKLTKDILGRNNRIEIGKNCTIHNSHIYIRGNNNKLIFGENCYIGPRCGFRCEGNDITIRIGDGTSMTRDVAFTAQEDGCEIILGKDCMLSNTIIIRTSDSHPIYNENGKRTNPAKSVLIGNHVWIAPNSTVMKGVTIGDEAVIASNTLVTKDVKPHTLVAGIPAKTVKEYVKWTREQLF